MKRKLFDGTKEDFILGAAITASLVVVGIIWNGAKMLMTPKPSAIATEEMPKPVMENKNESL